MEISSKFEKLYLLKMVLLPSICIGFCLLLLDVKFNYKKDIDVTYPVLFLFVIACCILFYNLNLLYKIVVNERAITQTFILSKKIKIINYRTIVKSEREFVEGYQSSEVGKITPGYHRYKFILPNEEVLLISPDYFKNYDELVNEINSNLNR